VLRAVYINRHGRSGSTAYVVNVEDTPRQHVGCPPLILGQSAALVVTLKPCSTPRNTAILEW
jgi:hypothetical protein